MLILASYWLAASVDDDAVSPGEQLNHPIQRYGCDSRGNPCRIDLIEQHHGLISLDFNGQLVLEKVKILAIGAWDLLQRHAHLLGEALPFSLRQPRAIQRG